MLDFDREEEALREQVGADSRQILSLASAAWADRLWLARARLEELAAEANPTAEAVLERDRLGSFFGCAYGREGLLCRAGALVALRDRLQRLAVLAPRLVADAPGMARLRREAVIARSFARARLGRPRQQGDRELFETVQAACRAAVGCADFVAAALALDKGRSGFFPPGRLHALSDLGYLAADTSVQRPLLNAAAFLLARLADHKDTLATDGAFDALIEAHLAGLRDSLWDAVEAQLGERAASLPALEAADRELEGLLGRLSDKTLPGAGRARLLADLFALAACGRCVEAQRRLNIALEASLAMLAEGLAAEFPGARS